MRRPAPARHPHDAALRRYARRHGGRRRAQIGADEWIAEALPERKVAIIRELQQEGRVVAMIGDGVNDAPSLAQADLGIALGSGADIAMQAAPLVLMGRSLGAVIEDSGPGAPHVPHRAAESLLGLRLQRRGHHAGHGRNSQSDTGRGGDGALQPLGDRQFPPVELGEVYCRGEPFGPQTVSGGRRAGRDRRRFGDGRVRTPSSSTTYIPCRRWRGATTRSVRSTFPRTKNSSAFMRDGGITRFVYGGNAFLYQITLAEYAELTHWLGGLTSQATIIPAVGPSFGRAIDQAPLIRRYKFPSVLVLPTGDPRDAAGLERGMREIAEACGIPLSLYVKRENDFGDDLRAGMDVIGRLVDSKVCVSIKYAVVRKDPAVDPYLTALLERVDRSRIISGIGERPAIVHLRNFGLTGFTTGSGVLAPKLCRALLDACSRKDYEQAEKLRAAFLPLEDLRDEWGPPRVIHAAVALAGVAETGPIPPFVSELSAAQKDRLRPVARELLKRNG